MVCLLILHFFIPQPDVVLNEATAKTNTGIIYRVAEKLSYRNKWLPLSGKQATDTVYELDGCQYLFPAENSFNNNIIIIYNQKRFESLLTVRSVKDSALITWAFTWQPKTNLLTKLPAYLEARHIRKVNEKILESLVAFVQEPKNIYGINFFKTIQTDSTLISIKSALINHFPTTDEIYSKIDKLTQHAVAGGAVINKPPMLNISYNYDSTWSFMVALPINKELQNQGEIQAKRMFAGGKILESDPITGGTQTIDHFIQEMENFRFDNNYLSPAIPFQSLITDRRKERDSTKWITKLYYPVY